MTAKRFTTDGLWIEDNVRQHSFHVTSENNIYALTDLLNILAEKNEQLRKDVARYRGNFREMEDVKCELAEENEQLKSRCNDYDKALKTLQDLTDRKLKENDWLKSIHFANDVLKENKELKQSNERLLKMLDNVANYMQKQNKYMPVDDFAEWWNGIATKGLDDGDVK